jgi:hypothetical protein
MDPTKFRPLATLKLWQLIPLVGLIELFTGCASHRLPPWVNGESPAFPNARYLTGVGIAADRKAAENEAIAGIARIFQARVNSVSEDLIKSRTRTDQMKKEIVTEESFTQKSEISTNVVLQGVVIAEIFLKDQKVYALATLEKAAARRRLAENISSLDQEIKALTRGYETSASKMEKIRKLKGLIGKGIERASMSAELQIVSPVGIGGGDDAGPNLGKLLNEIEELRFRNFKIVVQVNGTFSQEFKNSVEDGLTSLSFVVAKEESLSGTDLFILGTVDVSELDHPDKSWKWMQYSADFSFIDPVSQKTIRTIPNIRGQVAQLTYDAARIKAVQTLKEKCRASIQEEINRYIYGEEPK